jgi:hypothetical protein
MAFRALENKGEITEMPPEVRLELSDGNTVTNGPIREKPQGHRYSLKV